MKKLALITISLLLLSSCLTSGIKKETPSPSVIIDEVKPDIEQSLVVEEVNENLPEENQVELDEEVASSPEMIEEAPEIKQDLTEIIESVSKELDGKTEENKVELYGEELEDSVILGDLILPRWFIRACFFLLFAILIALCFISNQKKTSWKYRNRD